MTLTHKQSETVSLDIAWEGSRVCKVILDPRRAIFLPDLKTLVIADVHLGKAFWLGKNGIAIPKALEENDLETIVRLCADWRPDRLLILGDLIDRHDCLNPDLIDKFSEMQKQIAAPITLVRGNHDSGSPLPKSWDLEVLDSLELGSVRFEHEEVESIRGRQFQICGHLHPIATVRSPWDRMTLPCFWWQKSSLTLPAFGGLTGGAPITPSAQDGVYLVAPERVFSVPADHLH